MMTQDEMKELREYLDGKFGAVDKRFDGVDHRLDGMDKRFDGVDERLDGMEKRFDGVDGRLDRIEATMEQEFGAITTQFVELRGYIDDAYERTNGRMDVQFDALRADLRITRERD
jgi:archaellum component FlaC